MRIFSKLFGAVLPPPINWIVSGLGWVKDIVFAAIKLAIANPWQAGCLVLAMWLAFVHVHTIPAKNHEIAVQSGAKDILAKRFVDERRAFNAFVVKVELARKVAAELDQQNAKRFKLETETRISEIEDENVELRNRNRSLIAQRMRNPGIHTASVGLSSGGETNLPVISDLPRGAVQGSGAAIISESDALICADNYTTLTSLIAAWKAIETVNVNGADPPTD